MNSSVTPPKVVNIADLRKMAEARLPKMVFDYGSLNRQKVFTTKYLSKHELEKKFKAFTYLFSVNITL